MSINHVILQGRLSVDPMISVTKNESHRCWFTIAVTDPDTLHLDKKEQIVHYHEIVTWGKAAQNHAQYLAKGDEITVDGKLVSRSIKTETGFDRQVYVTGRIQYGRRSEKNKNRAPVSAPAGDRASQVAELTRKLAMAAGGQPVNFGAMATATPAAPTHSEARGESPFAASKA